MSAACPSSCPHTHLTWTVFPTYYFTWLQRCGGGTIVGRGGVRVSFVWGEVRVPCVGKWGCHCVGGKECDNIHMCMVGCFRSNDKRMCMKGPSWWDVNINGVLFVQVEWDTEEECFQTLAKELGLFYSIQYDPFLLDDSADRQGGTVDEPSSSQGSQVTVYLFSWHSFDHKCFNTHSNKTSHQHCVKGSHGDGWWNISYSQPWGQTSFHSPRWQKMAVYSR